MPNERHYNNELNLESVGINQPFNMQAEQSVLGAVLLIGAALMLPPLLVALIYHEVSGWYFLWVMLGAAVLGALALRLGGGKRAVM